MRRRLRHATTGRASHADNSEVNQGLVSSSEVQRAEESGAIGQQPFLPRSCLGTQQTTCLPERPVCRDTRSFTCHRGLTCRCQASRGCKRTSRHGKTRQRARVLHGTKRPMQSAPAQESCCCRASPRWHASHVLPRRSFSPAHSVSTKYLLHVQVPRDAKSAAVEPRRTPRLILAADKHPPKIRRMAADPGGSGPSDAIPVSQRLRPPCSPRLGAGCATTGPPLPLAWASSAPATSSPSMSSTRSATPASA